MSNTLLPEKWMLIEMVRALAETVESIGLEDTPRLNLGWTQVSVPFDAGTDRQLSLDDFYEKAKSWALSLTAGIEEGKKIVLGKLDTDMYSCWRKDEGNYSVRLVIGIDVIRDQQPGRFDIIWRYE